MSRVPRRALLLVCAAIILSAATASASSIDVSTTARPVVPANIATWLEQRGLDASRVVFQNAALNYAGPNCPGDGWSCAPAGMPVIQAGVNNQFDCTQSPCVANQQSNGGSNVANCTLVSSDAAATESCDFTQSNTTGSNSINASQSVGQNGGFTQSASQTVTCSQTNQSGSNAVTTSQGSTQTTSANLNIPVTHTQDVHETVNCTQTSTTGGQQANIGQSQDSSSDLIAAAVNQRQNNGGSGPNLTANVKQRSGSGTQNVKLDQNQNLDQKATAVGAISQIQGPATGDGQPAATPSGGLAGDIDVDSPSGTSTYQIDQNKVWSQDLTTVSTHSQTQDDRLYCCLLPDQLSQTPDSGTINQKSSISASTPEAVQRVVHDVKAAAKTAITYTSTIQFDGGAPTTETKTGRYINSDRTCTETACNTTPQSPSTIHAGVRCDTCGETAYKDDTTAARGNTVGGQFLYQNFSEVPAPDVEIDFTVPAGTTLVKAPGCTSSSNAAGTLVRCKLGTGEAGGVRSVTLTLKIANTAAHGSTITLTGTVTTGNSPQPVSDSATIHVS